MPFRNRYISNLIITSQIHCFNIWILFILFSFTAAAAMVLRIMFHWASLTADYLLAAVMALALIHWTFMVVAVLSLLISCLAAPRRPNTSVWVSLLLRWVIFFESIEFIYWINSFLIFITAGWLHLRLLLGKQCAQLQAPQWLLNQAFKYTTYTYERNHIYTHTHTYILINSLICIAVQRTQSKRKQNNVKYWKYIRSKPFGYKNI